MSINRNHIFALCLLFGAYASRHDFGEENLFVFALDVFFASFIVPGLVIALPEVYLLHIEPLAPEHIKMTMTLMIAVSLLFWLVPVDLVQRWCAAIWTNLVSLSKEWRRRPLTREGE